MKLKKIEYIKKIDNNDDLYKSFLKENILIDDKINKYFYEQKEFLWNIFEQDKLKAYRRFD